MDRHFQAGAADLGHHRKADCDKALHVGGATPIQASVALDHFERRAGPRLAVDRDHIGMSRQYEAGPVLRPDRHPQRCLLPRFIREPPARYSK